MVLQSRYEHPRQSFGIVSERSDSPYAQAVHAFFDRMENICPRYVTRLPSILVGVIVFNIIMYFTIDPIAQEKHKHRHDDDIIKKMTWLGVFVAVVTVGVFVSSFISEKLYIFDSIHLNKWHFAGSFWAGEYIKAMRNL